MISITGCRDGAVRTHKNVTTVGHVDRDKWPIELLTNWSAGLSEYQAFPTNAM
jgi:hypothetical protein